MFRIIGRKFNFSCTKYCTRYSDILGTAAVFVYPYLLNDSVIVGKQEFHRYATIISYIYNNKSSPTTKVDTTKNCYTITAVLIRYNYDTVEDNNFVLYYSDEITILGYNLGSKQKNTSITQTEVIHYRQNNF